MIASLEERGARGEERGARGEGRGARSEVTQQAALRGERKLLLSLSSLL
jgi:hypothetical protein